MNITDTVVNYTGKPSGDRGEQHDPHAHPLLYRRRHSGSGRDEPHASRDFHPLARVAAQRAGWRSLPDHGADPAHGTHTFRICHPAARDVLVPLHTMLQEQVGMYGAIVIHPRDRKPEREAVLLLSDWSDMDPDQIERGLHFATDWFMIRKNAVQSYGEALVAGQLGPSWRTNGSACTRWM